MRDRNTHTERTRARTFTRVYPRRIYAHIAFATSRSRGVKRANRRTCADQSKRATRARRPIETRDDVVRRRGCRPHRRTRRRARDGDARRGRRDATRASTRGESRGERGVAGAEAGARAGRAATRGRARAVDARARDGERGAEGRAVGADARAARGMGRKGGVVARERWGVDAGADAVVVGGGLYAVAKPDYALGTRARREGYRRREEETKGFVSSTRRRGPVWSDARGRATRRREKRDEYANRKRRRRANSPSANSDDVEGALGSLDGDLARGAESESGIHSESQDDLDGIDIDDFAWLDDARFDALPDANEEADFQALLECVAA